ncbi:type II secretion system F family protein [Arthrobacter sp. HY1533]|uniref:type II secretion system F family protein n=1 Tax=Arthrobacter sp. HY1533 TaxID=2970919 RepID=UPI0022BA045C|nr:type II secretion system F family protein [Arthrobacter sp. HY1533]
MPLLLELLGAALDSGLTVQGALRVVANVADLGIREGLLRVVAGLEIGASWQSSWEGSLGRGDIARIHEALSFGALTGAPAAPILYAEAQQHRTAAGRLAEKRAAALGVKLVLPLGLCSLPAFIALGIVPVVVAMVPAF